MEDSEKNTITEEFLNLRDILKRDTTPTKQETRQEKEQYETYQMQATKGSKTGNLFYLGKYTQLPIQNILSFTHPMYSDMKCDMISYTLTTDDIKNQKYLKMIGFLLCIGDKIVCSCDFVFSPINLILLKKDEELINSVGSINSIDGQFKIILFQKQKGIYKETVIKEYTEYCGREESIYILTTVLIEENVVEKYIRN